MIPLINLSLILVFAVAMGFGQSEENPFQLPDTVMVTAERFPSPINETPWVARTLLRQKFAHKLSLSDALDGVAGADNTGYGMPGHLSNLMLWGSSSSQLLLLYDGRPVYNFASGGFNLSEFNLSEFERIEIVKGTQSALYGSDAIGGVINLVPRIHFPNKISGSVEYGRFGFFGYNLAATKKLGNWQFDADYQRDVTDNYRRNSGVKRNNLTVKSFLQLPRSDWEAILTYRYFADSLGLPGPAPNKNNIPYYGNAESESLVNNQKDLNHSVDIRLKSNSDGNSADNYLSGEIDIFYDKKKLDYFGRYAYLTWTDSVDTIDKNAINTGNSGLTGRIHISGDNFKWSGGVEFLSGSSSVESKSIVSRTDISNAHVTFNDSKNNWSHRRDIFALWCNNSHSIGHLASLDLSGRLESVINNDRLYESFNAGFRFFPAADLSFKLAYGIAYRLPAFNDLYWPEDNYSSGNPNLIPERGENYLFSLGIKPAKNLKIDLNAFHKRVENLISWAPLGEMNEYGSPRWTPSNINHFRSNGLEMELSYSVSKIIFEGDLTFQDAKQENSELIFSGVDGSQIFSTVKRQAAFVAPLKCRMAISAEFWGINYDFDMVYTSKRRNYYQVYSFDDMYNSLITYAEKRLSESYLIGLSAEKGIGKHVIILLTINDLLNTKPVRQFGGQFDNDYPSGGRTARLKIFFHI